MADSGSDELRLEIAHVLFIDTVGYSKLSTPQQHAVSTALNQLVRTAPTFQKAAAAQELIRLPTGDGMVLVFYDRRESPIECAIEIHEALRQTDVPGLRLRMGIHSGPVTRLDDVNDQSNVAGAGVNTAQRVMAFADAGHILLSERVAEDLREDERWRPHLHPLGSCESKHGATLHLVNFANGVAGNPARPRKLLKGASEPDLRATARKKSARRQLLVLGGTGLLIALLAAAATVLFYYLNHRPSPLPDVTKLPAKSVAVLRFESRSTEKENEFFTLGVAEEIRAALKSVSDLKVSDGISSNSFTESQPRNLRAIAEALSVAYLVEGSVQRANGKVRVIVELIDARSGESKWSEHYDRDLRDVFAIQSEVAERIAAELEARISPAEKAIIEKPITESLEAYDLYNRGVALGLTIIYDSHRQQSLFEAAQLLEQAVQLDPKFLLAYCQLARVHDVIYILGIDHTAERLGRGEAAAARALTLQPQAGPAHLALAFHYYCAGDHLRAREELAIAEKSLPNEPRIFEITAYILRREGRFDEAAKAFQRALTLDPRNLYLLQEVAGNYEILRRFGPMAQTYDRALLLDPQNPSIRVSRALIAFQAKADPAPVHATLTQVLKGQPDAAKSLATLRFYVALCARDPAAAERAIADMPAGGFHELIFAFPDEWCVGLVARLRGDSAAATQAFTEARATAAEVVARQPDYVGGLCVLGMIDAMLGRKAEALAEGRRAVALMPPSQDALNGELLMEYLAFIYAWCDEPEAAVAQLAAAAKRPGQLTYGDLRLNPFWDPLRARPDFAKVVASLAPAP